VHLRVCTHAVMNVCVYARNIGSDVNVIVNYELETIREGFVI
jgi:hypothetical protein